MKILKKILILIVLINISKVASLQAQVVTVDPYISGPPGSLGSPPNNRVSPTISDYSDDEDPNTFSTTYSYTIGDSSSPNGNPTTISGIGVNGLSSTSGNVKPDNTITLWGGTNTTGPKTVNILVRAPTSYEQAGAYIPGGPHLPPIIGNPFEITGLDTGVAQVTQAELDQAGAGDILGSRRKTDPYAIVGTYNQAEFDATTNLDEDTELTAGHLTIGWLNTDVDGALGASQADPWVNAIQGNFSGFGTEFTSRDNIDDVISDALINTTFEEYVAGTATSMINITKNPGEIRVGDWGGSDDNNEVWAVVDHISNFVLIPETSKYSFLLGLIFLSLAILHFRKQS